MYEDLALYIDGEWCQGSTGDSEDVINPATEKVLGVLPHASPADLDRALDAADRGFRTWRAVKPPARAGILKPVGELIRARADHLPRIMTPEPGQPPPPALAEVHLPPPTYR